jgi:chemotaxis protein histidine kinase CheA
MFGFDDIAGFAHNLETVFDRLRNGHLAATADLISLTLAAGDQMKTMLDEAAGHGAVDRARSAGILGELRQLTGLPEPQPAHRAHFACWRRRRASGLAHRMAHPLPAGANRFIEWNQPAVTPARAAGIGPTPDKPRYGRYSAPERDRTGSLLPRLGHGSHHGGGA